MTDARQTHVHYRMARAHEASMSRMEFGKLTRYEKPAVHRAAEFLRSPCRIAPRFVERQFYACSH